MPEYARKNYEPQKKVIPKVNGGVVFNAPPQVIEDHELSSVLNLQYYRNVLRADTGLVPLNTPVRGIPQQQIEFINTVDVVQEILVTTATVYLQAAGQWQYVSDGVVNQALSAQTLAGSNIFQFNTANLSVGNFLGITLSDGTQLQTTVLSVDSATQIHTNDVVPPGKTANLAAAVVRPPVLNGVADFSVDFVIWPITNLVIFTNGVDPIWQFNGAAVSPLPGWTNITARLLIEFHNFLLAMDTTELGIRFPYRVRNSDQGNPTNATTGLSGFVDLADTEDFITDVHALGPWIIIYRGNNIMRRSYIGDPLQLFFDEYMVTQTGAYSADATSLTGASHVFIGSKGIFRYTGGYDLEAVGDKVYDYILGPQGIINPNRTDRIVTAWIPESDEVWFFIPTGTNDWLDTLIRYNQGDESFWIRQFAYLTSGIGFISTITTGRTWQQANVQWNQDPLLWLAGSRAAKTNQIVLCDPINFKTRIYDYQAVNDDGVPYSWSFITKDFQSPPYFIRLDGFIAQGRGSNVLVEVSGNAGQTWQTMGTLNFGLSLSVQNVNLQIVAPTLMFRISGTDPLFQLNWYRVDFFEETPW